MEVHKARAFLTVAEELHFGRAAKRLHMAQPPLSRLIHQLETELGAKLFERDTRNVTLTPEGEAILQPARELLMLSQRIKDVVVKSQKGEVGGARLGFAGASVNQAVGELARQIRRQRPGISLKLYSSEFSHLGLQKVLDRSLDLVIGRWDFLPAEISSRVVGVEELLIALPENHRLAGQDTVAAEDLVDESWLVLPGGAGATLPNRLNALGVDAGFVPRIVQVAPDSGTLVVLVGAEMGIALTLSSVRDHVPSRGVVYRPLRNRQKPVEVRLIWRRDDVSPGLRAVVDISKSVFPPPDTLDPESASAPSVGPPQRRS
ncbi:LysR family transcriptional regulator [Nesterenkonia sp. AN1]|uniref:LysR family transcriptional regulator n=1 Tax=Nesterenkonia aurantiaca TaxID=1436010 RepID=A0A4R7G7D3_9MICC|nr:MULTISPECIES: LysR family transcriptional regulator [Nesterenkonia]EXF25695.1 LysR family transcriptional regulator [Nesterenkonia sp. AN1]TDS87380.1 LysR family transcriptional regulator [Nesterenkonia aurantiaca]